MAEAGKVRTLACATAERLPELPDVPTSRQAGLDFVYNSWFGLMTQAAVPRDIVHKINRDVVAIVHDTGGRTIRRAPCGYAGGVRPSFVTRRRSSPRCSRGDAVTVYRLRSCGLRAALSHRVPNENAAPDCPKRGGLGDRPEPGLRQYRHSDAPENERQPSR